MTWYSLSRDHVKSSEWEPIRNFSFDPYSSSLVSIVVDGNILTVAIIDHEKYGQNTYTQYTHVKEAWRWLHHA